MDQGKVIYKLNDRLLFRVCGFDDCTEKSFHWSDHSKKCNNVKIMLGECLHTGAVHLHCPLHREIELVTYDSQKGPKGYRLVCAICASGDVGIPDSLKHLTPAEIQSFKDQALALKSAAMFKGAKLVRLDDYYVPELSVKSVAAKTSKYWVSYDVKRNSRNEPVMILYLGDREEMSKAQFFIEPETQKLTHDHKDTQPVSVISRIEVKFKSGVIELKERPQEKTDAQ